MLALYWDFDGTLVESGPIWTESVWEALKRTDTKTKVTFEQIRPHMAYGFPWHSYQNTHKNTTGGNWWAAMNRHFEQAYLALGVIPETAHIAASRVREILLNPTRYTIYPDAKNALQACREAGCINILLSNQHPDLEYLLAQLGLARYFDALVISGIVGYEKPRREIFEIAKRLCPNAEAHIMIGDSLTADIAGGKSAGMQTVLVHKGFSPEADFCMDTLTEVACKFAK